MSDLQSPEIKQGYKNFNQPRTALETVKIFFIYGLIFIIILPVILFLAGKAIDSMLQGLLILPASGSILGWILLSLGVILTAGSMIQLSLRGNGYPISHLPPQNLVARGFYRHIRHPIYSGFILFISGWALTLQSAGMLLVSVPLLIAGVRSYIRFFEEPILIERFGESYKSYKKRVPALLFPLPFRQLFRSLKNRVYDVFNPLANKTILFRYGDMVFVTYGLLTAIGIVLYMQHCVITLISQGLPVSQAGIFITGCGLAGVAGARIYWWVEHIKILINEPLFGFRKVGFVSWGAALGLFAFVIPFSHVTGFTILTLTDVLFSGMFIGYSIGRIGCLTYGCCYGKITDGNGVIYHSHQAKVNRLKQTHGTTRYPTQLFSAAHGLILFVILNLILSFEWPAGILTVFALIYYGIGRAWEEFNRDRERIGDSIFTEGHVGAFLFIIGGLLLALFISPDSETVLRAWTTDAFWQGLILSPLIILLGLVLFFVLAYHNKQIGKW